MTTIDNILEIIYNKIKNIFSKSTGGIKWKILDWQQKMTLKLWRN